MSDTVESLEAEREAAGISQAALMRQAGVSPPTWWRLREGKFEPQQSTLRRVRAALDELTGSIVRDYTPRKAGGLAVVREAARVLESYGLAELSIRLDATADALAATAAHSPPPASRRPAVPADTAGERLRQARRSLELTAEELGEQVGLKGVSVRAHETGQNGISADAANKYAAALGCPPEWIMFGTVSGGSGEEISQSGPE